MGSVRCDSRDWETKSWSSIHLSPKYRAALLFGACQRKGETPVLTTLSPTVEFDTGGVNFVVSFKYVDGRSRLRERRFWTAGLFPAYLYSSMVYFR